MRKLPIKTQVFKLNSDYEGWEFQARTNPPMRVVGDLASGDFDRIIEALTQLVLAWNFVDEEGADMLPPSQETIGELPLDLAIDMSTKIVEASQKLPKA